MSCSSPTRNDGSPIGCAPGSRTTRWRTCCSTRIPGRPPRRSSTSAATTSTWPTASRSPSSTAGRSSTPTARAATSIGRASATATRAPPPNARSCATGTGSCSARTSPASSAPEAHPSPVRVQRTRNTRSALAPPGVGGPDRHGALVGAREVARLERGRRRLVDLATLKVVVDLLVAEAELGLVGLAGLLVEQVGRGRLLVEPPRRLEVDEERAALTLRQPAERKHIRSPVAELGEEARDRLGRMVGAHHEG